MAAVITASEPSWIAPFAGLSPRCFGKLETAVRIAAEIIAHSNRSTGLPLTRVTGPIHRVSGAASDVHAVCDFL